MDHRYHDGYYSHSPKSRWNLLGDFQQLSEDEIEMFLPQICNILFSLDNNEEDRKLFQYFESILLNKCADSLPFGMRLSGMLSASFVPQSPTESIFKLMSGSASRSDELFMSFQEKVQYYTEYGGDALPTCASELRRVYCSDYQYLLECLTRLGYSLKNYPVRYRSTHLRNALMEYNSLLHHRM